MATRVDVTSPSFSADPFAVYAEMRRNSPVCQVDPGGFWAVTRYEDVMQVLKDYQSFSSQGLRSLTQPAWLDYNPLSNAPAVLDPPLHTRVRSVVNRAFSPKVNGLVEPLIRGSAEQLAERLRDGGDFIRLFAEPVAATALCHLLGLDASEHLRFRRWVETLLSLTPVAPPPERIAAIQAHIAEGTDSLRGELEERRRSPRADLLSTIAQAQVEGFSELESLGLISGILGGGLQTVTHMLTLCMLVLLEQPGVLRQLQAEPGLIPRFVDEVLRHQSPLMATLRMTTREVELSGVRLPEGAVIYVALGSANRDERQFPDADVFRLDRGPLPLLIFGQGIHFCVGAALARLEARLAFEVLLSRFSRFEPLYERLEWNGFIHMRALRALPLRAIPAAAGPQA